MRHLVFGLIFVLFLPRVALSQTEQDIALGVLDEFLAHFNNQNDQGMAETLNYPHVRIARGKVVVWDSAEEFLATRKPERRARRLQATGWHHTQWTERTVIQHGPSKVHIAVEFTRYREDESVIGRYQSFYIVTKQDDHWGIQGRSSFLGSQ